MSSNRLGLAGCLVAALLATLALSAITASAAHAEEAPHWVVAEKSLKENESRLLTVKAYNGTKEPITLEGETSSGVVKVECTLVIPINGAKLIGGEPGTVEFFVELSHCTQKGNGVEPCKVAETIETHTLKGELVVNTAVGTRAISNSVELGAANGSTKELVTLPFSGTGCSVKTVTITDLALGQFNTDPEAGGTKEEATSASTGEYSSFLLRFPGQTTKEVWLWKAPGIREEFTITPLHSGSAEWSLKGSLLFSLAHGEKFGVKGDPPKCKSKKTKWVFCADEVEVLTKTIARTTSGALTLESTTGGVAIKIECTSTTFVPTLEPGGGMKVTDTFEGCSVNEPRGSCEVEGKKLTTESLAGKLLPEAGEKPSVILEGGKIASFKIIGCETFEGTYTLSGAQTCKFEVEHEEERLEHEIKCEKTESKLKLEGGKFKSEAVSLSIGARGPLTGEPDWSIQLN